MIRKKSKITLHLEGCEGDVCTCKYLLAKKMQKNKGVTLREYLEIKGEYIKKDVESKGNTRT